MANNLTVGDQMADILDEVSKNVKGVMQTAIKQTAVETAMKLRNSSPKKYGDYSLGWKAGKQRGGDYVVHNATEYRLTHLLENGHVVRNKKGTYGRAPAYKHIEPAEEWASDELPRRIMEGIE